MRGSRNLCRGRAGPTARKQPGQRFFFVSFFFFFFLSNLFYSLQRGSDGSITLQQRKLYFSKDQEGVQLFPGGSNFFQGGGGGVKC